jgi:hypothetical protein
LDLEEPDTDIDRKAKRARMLGVMVGAELGERYALAGTDVFEDSGEVLAKLFVVMVATVVFRTREYPWRVEVGAQDADMVLARHHQRYV